MSVMNQYNKFSEPVFTRWLKMIQYMEDRKRKGLLTEADATLLNSLLNAGYERIVVGEVN